MDVRALYAAQKYAALKPATGAEAGATVSESAVKDTARGFLESMEQAETLARDAMTQDADPHALVQALAQSQLAVETVVTVRNKVVEAYQEILRMPV